MTPAGVASLRAERELQRLNRAWRVRSLFNRSVARSSDEHELLRRVCQTMVKVGGYQLAWIAHVKDGKVLPQLTRYSFCGQSPAPNELMGVMGMIEDQQGNLWLGVHRASACSDSIERTSSSFISKTIPPTSKAFAEDKVIALFEDREGNIWAGLHSFGPNHVHPKPPLFEKFRHEPGKPNGLEMDFINAMFEDSQGTISTNLRRSLPW